MQVATLRVRHAGLAAVFTERSRHHWTATEARAIGHGGIALVERATGISRSTIQRGLRELDDDAPLAPERTRKAGGGNASPRSIRPGGHEKKELIGDFKNGGRAWRPKGTPERVRVHDFLIAAPGHGKAIPYGVYDLHRDEGGVSVGIDHDTASFAVNGIRRWWHRMGRAAYPQARSIVITADAAGSNGTRLRLWKWELQRFANRTGLTITVCHFPPGTSKWNRIEHRLFSHIAMNWRGTPLVNLARS